MFVWQSSLLLPNQILSRVYVEKRQNGGLIFQRALSVPFPLQGGGGASFEGEGMS